MKIKLFLLFISILNFKIIIGQNLSTFESGGSFPFFNCIGNLEYLGVDKIQPFGFNQDPYVLQWGDGSGSNGGNENSTFPEVLVEISGENNPLLVGNVHAYEKLERDNTQFFDIAGKQDIKSLMHYTCGKSESAVTFSFKEQFEKKKEFILLVFGMNPNTVLNIKAYDWSGQLLPGATWQELERGILHHGAKDIVRMQSNLNLGKASANLKWTGGSLTTYDIFYPALSSSKISKIELYLSHSCNAPECKGVTLFYSLIANDLCYKQPDPITKTPTTPKPIDTTQTPIPIKSTDPPTIPPTQTPSETPTQTPIQTPEASNSDINSEIPNPIKNRDDDITVTVVPQRHRATRPPYRERRSPPPTQTIPSAWD